MATKKVKKVKSKGSAAGRAAERITVTFDPEPDVLALLQQAEGEGRGVRSRVINQVIREHGPTVLQNWKAFRQPGKAEDKR